MKLQIFIEGTQVDLFEDEKVTIKKLVKDIKDPKKLFTDFSKSFQVPASKANNKLFKHYYRSDILDGLDARTLLSAEVRINFIGFAKGNIEVESVDMRDGKPFAYNINFYGELTQLRKKIGEDYLQNLDLGALTHSTDPLALPNFMGHDANTDILYPISSKGRRLFATGAASAVENSTDIQYSTTTQATGYGLERNDLSAFVKTSAIITAIEEKYGMTFEGAIKQGTVSDLYIRADRQKDTKETVTSYVDGWTVASGSVTIDANKPEVLRLGTGNTNGFTRLTFAFSNITPPANGNWKVKILGEYFDWSYGEGNDPNGFSIITDQISLPGQNPGYRVAIEAESGESISFDLSITELDYNFSLSGGTSTNTTETHTFNTITHAQNETFIATQQLPKVKVLDFLSELFTRFNIVAYMEDGKIQTEYYDYYISRGEIKDISDFFNQGSFSVHKSSLFSSLNFKNKPAETILEYGYETVNGEMYGDLRHRLTDKDGNYLSGEEYSIDSKATITPLEPLTTNISYGYYVDTNLSKKDTGLHFSYLAPVTDSIAYDNGGAVEELTDVWALSSVRKTATAFYNGLYFGEEINELTGASDYYGAGLFNVFHSNQVSLMFDQSKRLYRGTAKLPVSYLTNLKLSDRLSINGRLYLINSFDADMSTGETKLELISLDQTTSNLMSAVCREYTTGANAGEVLFLNSDGILEHQNIPANTTTTICSIGAVKVETGDITANDIESGTNNSNFAPVAAIAVDGTVRTSINAEVGETLTLTDASYDLNGIITGRSWSTGAGASTITVTQSTTQVQIITLAVYDDEGNTASTSLVINWQTATTDGSNSDTGYGGDPEVTTTQTPPCADTCPAGALVITSAFVGSDAAAFTGQGTGTVNYAECDCGNAFTMDWDIYSLATGEMQRAQVTRVELVDASNQVRAVYDGNTNSSYGIIDIIVTQNGGIVNVEASGNIPDHAAGGNNAYTLNITAIDQELYTATVNVVGTMTNTTKGNFQNTSAHGNATYAGTGLGSQHTFRGESGDTFSFTLDIEPDSGYSLTGAGFIQNLILDNYLPNASATWAAVYNTWDSSANGGNGKYTLNISGTIQAEDSSVEVDFDGTALAEPATTATFEYSTDAISYTAYTSGFVTLPDSAGIIYVRITPDGSWYSTLSDDYVDAQVTRKNQAGTETLTFDYSGDPVVMRLDYAANESLTESRTFGLNIHPRTSTNIAAKIKFSQDSQDGTNTTTTTQATTTSTTSTTSTTAATTSGGGGGGTTAAPTYYYFQSGAGNNAQYNASYTVGDYVNYSNGYTDQGLIAVYSTTNYSFYASLPTITGYGTPPTGTTTSTTTTTTTTTQATTYPYWAIEDENGGGGFAAGGGQWTIGDTVNVNGLTGCWEIIGSGTSTTQYNSITGACTQTTTTTTTTTTLPPYYAHQVGANTSTAQGACTAARKTVYSGYNRSPIDNQDPIYIDTALSTYSNAGYKEMGGNIRYWTGTSWSGSLLGCA
jgi:hypothetical protein